MRRPPVMEQSHFRKVSLADHSERLELPYSQGRQDRQGARPRRAGNAARARRRGDRKGCLAAIAHSR